MKQLLIKIATLAILFVLITLNGCVYDFEPDNAKYENNLVVYGLLTNENEPVEVFLSRTTNINDAINKFEENAQVEIIDGSENSTRLFEVGPGKYSTIENFNGLIGEKYQLKFKLQNGNSYESSFEVLDKPNDIGRIYYKYEKKETEDIEHPQWGCQFYADLEINSEDKGYIRYQMGETWEIALPYTEITFWNSYSGWIFPEVDKTCWKSGIIDEFYITSPIDYGSNNISEFPLTYVSNESSRLLIKYCLTVKQFTMSEMVYNFWKSQSNNLGVNSLYSIQPYQVIGNIKNLNDDSEIVLGIFEVSGVSKKHVFVDDNFGGVSEFAGCAPRSEPTWQEELYGYYWVYLPDGGAGVVDKSCIDCTEKGGTPEKPDFWE